MSTRSFLKKILSSAKVSSAHALRANLEMARPFSVKEASLTTEEDEGLKNLLAEVSQFEGPVVEIGTLIGATTMKMALWAPDKVVITVDNYIWNAWGLSREEHFDLARHSLYSLVELGRVQQINMDKAEFYKTYNGAAPSLVFLDAMHTYEETKLDIDWAKEIGAKMISGHDYCQLWPGVIQAVEEAGGVKNLYGSVWRL